MQIFQMVNSQDANFSKFSFSRPLFFQGKFTLQTLLLETCVAHTCQKKKLSAPPGNQQTGGISCCSFQTTVMFFNMHSVCQEHIVHGTDGLICPLKHGTRKVLKGHKEMAELKFIMWDSNSQPCTPQSITLTAQPCSPQGDGRAMLIKSSSQVPYSGVVLFLLMHTLLTLPQLALLKGSRRAFYHSCVPFKTQSLIDLDMICEFEKKSKICTLKLQLQSLKKCVGTLGPFWTLFPYAFYPQTIVYCYIEFKLSCLKIQKLFSIRVKELSEPIVL